MIEYSVGGIYYAAKKRLALGIRQMIDRPLSFLSVHSNRPPCPVRAATRALARSRYHSTLYIQVIDDVKSGGPYHTPYIET